MKATAATEIAATELTAANAELTATTVELTATNAELHANAKIMVDVSELTQGSVESSQPLPHL